MLSNLAVLALGASAVVAGPLQRRQETASSVASAATSAVESVISSAASEASTAVSSVASEASGVTSTAASAVSSAESSAAPSAASSSVAAGGEGGSEAYPCPAGFLLTYAAVNQTLQVPVTQVTAASGEWASSPLFPNVTDAQGGNEPGATHTINVGNISLPEVLVSVETNETSGSAIWNWNGSLTEPVEAMGVQLSNYSTVLQIYDPDFTTTGEIGNTTFINIFTNACAQPQAEAIALLTTLGGLELSNIATAVSGNSTEGGAAESSAAPSSAEPTESAASSVESSAAEATSSAASAAESVASQATSGAADATSAASSAVSAATEAAASAVSSATA